MKKTKRFMCLVSALATSFVLALTASAANYLGDVNDDGDVTASDVVSVQKYLVNKGVLSADKSEIADMNKDGKINVFDLILLKRTVIGEKEKIEIVPPTEETTEPTTEVTTEVTTTTQEVTDPTETTTVEVTTTQATTPAVTTPAVAGTNVNRAAIVATFNNSNASDSYWNQNNFENAAEGIYVPEITGDGTYKARLAVSNVTNINALGVRLFSANGTNMINSYSYANLNMTLDKVVIDGEDAVLTEGKTLADASANMSEFNQSNGGATVYLITWDGAGNSILPYSTAINEYIEITFTVTGLEN